MSCTASPCNAPLRRIHTEYYGGGSGDKTLLYYLTIARGSLSELETQIVIAKELGYLEDATLIDMQIDDVFGLLGGLIDSVRHTEQ
jgi:four helix bundle protein